MHTSGKHVNHRTSTLVHQCVITNETNDALLRQKSCTSDFVTDLKAGLWHTASVLRRQLATKFEYFDKTAGVERWERGNIPYVPTTMELRSINKFVPVVVWKTTPRWTIPPGCLAHGWACDTRGPSHATNIPSLKRYIFVRKNRGNRLPRHGLWVNPRTDGLLTDEDYRWSVFHSWFFQNSWQTDYPSSYNDRTSPSHSIHHSFSFAQCRS